MKLEVSSKHVKLRLILTILFFLIAVAAFTVGVLSIGRKYPGHQTIEAKTDAEALLYNKAVGFRYYLDGSSNQIKRGINALTEVYTPLLSAAYKELDHQNTYTGVIGLATINRNMGTELVVSSRLYDILKDAYARTLEKKGFNMFAGALYKEWESILILEDPQDFDPSNSAFQAQRIAAIAAMVNDLDNFKLEFVNDEIHSVRLTVSQKYLDFCRENEIDAPVLDLNILRDAYRLDMIAQGLSEAGYTDGYLYTAEGLVLNMSSRVLGYDLYTLEGTTETVYASIQVGGPFGANTLTAFGMGSSYSYRTTNPRYYRSRNFNVQTGDFSNIILSVTVIGNGISAVDAVLIDTELNNLATEAQVADYAATLETRGLLVSYTLQSDNN